MKKLQSSLWGKIIAVITLLAAAFGAGIFGSRALFDFNYMTADSWQSTSAFYQAVNMRSGDVQWVMDTAEEIRRLELLADQLSAQGDESGAQSYLAEAQYLEEELAVETEALERENTWFRFRVMDEDGAILYTNLAEGESLYRLSGGVWESTVEVVDLIDAASDEVELAPESAAVLLPYQTLTVEYGVPETVDESIPDEFYALMTRWSSVKPSFDVNLTGFLNLLALSLLALVWLLWAAGHKAGEEGIVTSWQERIFFDLYAGAIIAAGVFLFFSLLHMGDAYFRTFYQTASAGADYQTYETLVNTGLGTVSACMMGCAALLLRTLAVRLKARCLVRTTLLCRVVTWTVRSVHELIRFLPFTWKVVLGFLVYLVLNITFFTNARYNGGFQLMWFALNIALLLFLSWWAVGYYRLRKGTRIIAAGDLEHQIDTARMPHDLKLQAEDLNNISVGLAGAVDEKMKSERFKAELITNVSHDLKTPLTSIINYVNLLKSTEQSDPKAVEYIEVLDRKSQRLKKLTEDLVEASKASTGALSVNREKIGMAQLIDQAMGEWEEKLSARKLTLVLNLPEGETWVYADGRHLWRVLDNLLSNCAKYAMEGTRVYLDLVRGKGQVALSVKNISREPLNVPPERLMERFVRGEESRTTEGSGLGLSIARSLTELQGGSFALTVDGDLFKATVTLPQAS